MAAGAARVAPVAAAGAALRLEWRRLLGELPSSELRDVECDSVSGTLVDWDEVRKQSAALASAWRVTDSVAVEARGFARPPAEVCGGARGVLAADSEFRIVLARAADVARECVLGGLAAALVFLICVSEGALPPSTAAPAFDTDGSVERSVALATGVFEALWREALEGAVAVPVYMFGTTTWPIAALLAKWQVSAAASALAGPPPPLLMPAVCAQEEVQRFFSSVQSSSDMHLLPLVESLVTGGGAFAPDMAIGYFAASAVPALAQFMNSAAAANPSLYEECPEVAATHGAMLLQLRLLGPPVPRDPLDRPRLAELAASFARLSLADILARLSRAVPALLATSEHLAWRSHRLYGGGVDVSHAELRHALELGAECLQEAAAEAGVVDGGPIEELPGRYGAGLIESLHDDATARLRLWWRVAASPSLGPLWGLVARWLLAGEPPSARVVAGVAAPGRDPATLANATPMVGSAAVEGGGALAGAVAGDGIVVGGGIATEPELRGAAAVGGGAAAVGAARTRAAPSKPVFFTMAFGAIKEVWLRAFLGRADEVALPRLVFVTPDRRALLTCEDVRRQRSAEARLLCVRMRRPTSRIYDANNKAKFFLFPIIFALGVDVVWLDLDIFLFRDPTARLLRQVYSETAWPRDVLVTDHFNEFCLNHGVFIVRASDRSLLWLLEYIRWMHWYPFGHDQNGWDAFLGHSIVDPQLPENLRTDPRINVSYDVLNTEVEYLTLTGWAGSDVQRRMSLLLHFTSTNPISGRSKFLRLMALFNATGRRPGEKAEDQRRLDMARWKVLRPLRTSLPVAKRPCYEGIHMAVGQLVETGMYDELLA